MNPIMKPFYEGSFHVTSIKRGSMTGMLKQNSGPGNTWVARCHRILDATVSWKDRGNGAFGFESNLTLKTP